MKPAKPRKPKAIYIWSDGKKFKLDPKNVDRKEATRLLWFLAKCVIWIESKGKRR